MLLTNAFTEVFIRFAATGRIGDLHVGMSVEDLAAALRRWGLDSPDAGDPEFAMRHDSLDVATTDGRLLILGLDQDGDLAFTLPTALDERRDTVRLTKAEAVALLDGAGCAVTPDLSLTHPDQQSALRTGIGVSLVFARPSVLGVELSDDAEYLSCAYISAQPAWGLSVSKDVAFLLDLVKAFPQLAEDYEAHIENNGGALPHVFFWDVTQAVVSAHLGTDDEYRDLDWRGLIQYLEDVYPSADLAVKKVIVTSFLFDLPYPAEPGYSVIGQLGPVLAEKFAQVRPGE